MSAPEGSALGECQEFCRGVALGGLKSIKQLWGSVAPRGYPGGLGGCLVLDPPMAKSYRKFYFVNLGSSTVQFLFC